MTQSRETTFHDGKRPGEFAPSGVPDSSSAVYNPNKFKVSKDSHSWIDTYIFGKEGVSGTQTYIPSDGVIREMSSYRPNKPVVLYRYVAQEKGSGSTGQYIRSFTYSLEFAKALLEGNDGKGKIFKKTVYPDEIIVDTTKLPKEYQDEFLPNQYEVIVGYGKLLDHMQQLRGGKGMSLALWANSVVRHCLRESDGDVEAALSAANYIVSTQPMPDEVEIEQDAVDENGDPPLPVDVALLDAPFAFDIHNRRAQGILNRSLQAAKGIGTTARKDLEAALKKSAKDSGTAILKFIDKYRLQLAKLLSTTQLASLLEGAREVAAKVPTLAIFPGAVPPPPTLEPQKAVELINHLSQLTGEARAKAIYDLPANQQTYAQQALAAKEAGGPIVPPKFTPPEPPPGAPESIHFPIIDEAVKELSEKNVMTRERFDALDAAARAKAFTVANVEAEETLTKIRDSLAENIREGADYETWKQKVLTDMDQGTFLSEGHQETVFRTNVQGAFSDGQMVVLNHPLVRSGFPYSAYDAIHDSRVRETHLALEKHGIGGTNVYRNDDPVFQTFRPPWDYNDRCSWTPMTVRQASEVGIKEAQQWLDTGVEPTEKAFVKMPPFEPPPGFQRAVTSAPLSIRLSLQPIVVFLAFDPGEPRDEQGKWTRRRLTRMEIQKISEWREHLWNRRAVIKIAKQTTKNGSLEYLHPGEITVYRGRPPGSKSRKSVGGLSYTKSRKVAEHWAEGGKVEELIVTKNTPALDIGMALKGIPSKSAHEMEVFVVFNEASALSIEKGDKPEEETTTSLVYGEPEGAGSTTSASLDTAKEPPAGKRSTHIERRTKHKMKTVRGKRRSLFRRLRVKKKWRPEVSLSVDEEGCEHKGKGPDGGQFTRKGEGDLEPINKQGAVHKPAKKKKVPPGSQMPENLRNKLKEFGMVGSFPPSDVNMSDIQIADLSLGKEALKYTDTILNKVRADSSDRNEVVMTMEEPQVETVPNLIDRVGVIRDWDILKSVAVGTIENNVFAQAPWQPSIPGLPKEGGVSYEVFAPEQYGLAIEQLDNLCEILEKEGIKVLRPPVVPLDVAVQFPVGNTQVYIREAFSIIGDTILINQSRTPYRRKESRAAEAIFTGKTIVHLPPVPDDIPDSEPDDPLPYLEGGDVFRIGSDALITISGLATSPAGFRFVADLMAERGVTVWPAYIRDEFEHGDYVLMLVREGLCVAYRAGFVDGLLPLPILDWDCVEITRAEADPGVAANGIILRENVVLLPEGNRRVVRALEKKGVDVIEVPFNGVMFFQGGIDCATNELWREGLPLLTK